MSQTGTVIHCVPTQGGRFMIVIDTGKRRVEAYSDDAYAVGASVTVRDGAVL